MRAFLILVLALLSCAVVSPQNNVPPELDIYPDSVREESRYLTHFFPWDFQNVVPTFLMRFIKT